MLVWVLHFRVTFAFRHNTFIWLALKITFCKGFDKISKSFIFFCCVYIFLELLKTFSGNYGFFIILPAYFHILCLFLTPLPTDWLVAVIIAPCLPQTELNTWPLCRRVWHLERICAHGSDERFYVSVRVTQNLVLNAAFVAF